MAGQTDLNTLIRGMSATLQDGIYVFATVPHDCVPADIEYTMHFKEAEGTTLILPKTQAQVAGLPYEFPSRMITLNVHSALEAVGFLAAITRCLATQGMGVNPVAGFYHDHLFVPADRAGDAMRALDQLAQTGL
ncbi:MAG: ACT domain-containing protein [Pseudomonadota bacterium]